MSPSHPSALKRRKELARQERQREKARRKQERRENRLAGRAGDDDSNPNPTSLSQPEELRGRSNDGLDHDGQPATTPDPVEKGGSTTG
ncbi:MAG TPA: hypothetical protein VFA60_07700 [Terriglobales bacterium]|nr:hypothetical protein [Terriglobales bacterium]